MSSSTLNVLSVFALLLAGALWFAVHARNRPKRGFWTWVVACLGAAVVAVAAFYAMLYVGHEILDASFTDDTVVFQFGTQIVAAIAYLTFIGGAWGPGANATAAQQSHSSARPASSPPPAAAPANLSTQNPDVFISYKRDERPEVLAIAARLETLKVKIWFDAEMRSGTTFDAEIDRNVRAAKCVLVCWSPGAVASDWVRGEATIGRERGVLAACLLKACDLPAPFNLIHANDLRAGVGAHNPEWLAVLERVGALLARPGLSAFEALKEDRAAYAAWMAAYPHDPLFERVVAKLRGL